MFLKKHHTKYILVYILVIMQKYINVTYVMLYNVNIRLDEL